MPDEPTSEAELGARRQLIYASLLRYSPETVPLRDRVFDRLVTASLMGSTELGPYRIGVIQSNILFGANVPHFLRTERIQESLQRLQEAGKVRETPLRGRHAYYLTSQADDELRTVLGSAQDIFQPVLKKLLANTSHMVSYELSGKICTTFMCECFARFGAQMAKTVTGQLEPSDVLRAADAAAAFDAAASGIELSEEARHSLRVRCIEFLKSADPDALNLKFYLAQGYYFAQLAGFQNGGFSPLAEEAFRGSRFYLDTNVLLYGLLPDKEDNAIFGELLILAERLNITLVVTEATIKETLSLTQGFSKELSRVVEALPKEIVIRAKDQIAQSFLRAKEEDPNVSLDSFLLQMRNVRDVVTTKWKISICNEIEDQMIGADFPADVAEIIQEETIKSRGWEKPDAALRHDVAHLFLVRRERANNPKTWFLTRDRGLPMAANRLLLLGEQPFTFDFHGFLQTVSPFVTSTDERLGFAAIISSFLAEQLFPREGMFNVKELFLLVEMHQDVLSTPKDQLVQAVDYVKSTVLSGKQYRASDYNNVALGLKSFLASSSEEQRQELERQRRRHEQEAEQQKQVAAEERRLRVESLRRIQEQAMEIADLKEATQQKDAELGSLRDERERRGKEIDDLRSFQATVEKQQSRSRLFWVVVCYVAGLLIWGTDAKLAGYVLWRLNGLTNWTLALLFVRLLGLALFMGATITWLRKVTWKENRKIAILALTLLTGFKIGHLAEANISVFSMSALATSIGTVLLLFVDRHRLIGGGN
jgi:predicted nucleic acid-binding protein